MSDGSNTLYDPIMADLVPGYVDSQKKTLDSLSEALKLRNYNEVSEISHRIKGSAACYGFKEYGELAILLEETAQKQKHSECMKILDLMQKEF